MTSQKWVYTFGKNHSEGTEKDVELLGGKGANLAQMARMGLPVPPGFTLSTVACNDYFKNGNKLSAEIMKQTEKALVQLEEQMGKKFGDENNPLLVSVRSGARKSMPGMMDTVLNIGLTHITVKGLAIKSNNPRFAYDCYRRLIQMYGDVVMGVSSSLFEREVELIKYSKKYKSDYDLTVDDLKNLIQNFKDRISEELGLEFPENPKVQLWNAIEAVFKSWNAPRARTYRKLNQIPEDWGTAVNVQTMVFGNLGETSATGVAFTRDPSTGEKKFFGEYLLNAQGEDVVAGIRTPLPINRHSGGDPHQSLEVVLPECYRELENIAQKLETHKKDMQDLEFTIENKTLYMLQTRNGKRSAAAAVKIAVDMVDEKIISEKEAVLRIDPYQLDQLLHPRLDPHAPKTLIAKGLPASPGAATGMVVFSSLEAEKWSREGKKVILVRHETSPEDIGGMASSEGILTALGGMTSHAAVVARGMGKCCVAGCSSLNIDFANGQFTIKNTVVKRGDIITLDGSTGDVILGEVPTVSANINDDFKKIMSWVDKVRQLRVRANADSPTDARSALSFGAEGIGLCRTEHMFFEGDRVDLIREMILADTHEGRVKALEKLEPLQQNDFAEIYMVMKNHPVTIRLLDPPLHEFLPHNFEEVRTLARKLNLDPNALHKRIDRLKEFNPMLGHRGCRLALSYPEIYEMQVRAILHAACSVSQKHGLKVHPEIMIPLVAHVAELKILKKLVHDTAEKVFQETKTRLNYSVGTMIELPRAALTAHQIAEEAEFFSFGTNDLTQTTLGLSRDDAARFLPDYMERNIFLHDPFSTLDAEGVGALIEHAVQFGRKTRKDLKIGVCGEHGGDPNSIMYFHHYGVDYISCSPFRIPVARLAAAHATLKK